MTYSTNSSNSVKRSLLIVAAGLFMTSAYADVQIASPLKGTKATAKAAVVDNGLSIKQRSGYQSPGKVSAPLTFVKPARYQGASGDIVEVELMVRATDDINGLNVRINTDKNLELHNYDDRMSFETMRAGQTQTLKFDVLALADGLSYVNVICEVKTDNGPRMTSYAVPLEVGNVKAAQAIKTKPRLMVDKQGTVLHVMDARDPDARLK